VTDAAKSYRSDILGHSVQEMGRYYPEFAYAPVWPGRDTSIAMAEAALAQRNEPSDAPQTCIPGSRIPRSHVRPIKAPR
jgi:hypothetical protein